MFGMSLTEIAVILIVGLVILGPEKLPEMMRTVGKALREVRKAGNLLRDTIMLEEQEFNRKNNPPPAYQQPTALDHVEPPHDDYGHHDYDHYDHYADDELHMHHGLHEYQPMDPPTRFEIVLHEQRADVIEGAEVELAPAGGAKATSVDDAWYDAMTDEDDSSDDLPTSRDVPLHMQLPDAGQDLRVW